MWVLIQVLYLIIFVLHIKFILIFFFILTSHLFFSRRKENQQRKKTDKDTCIRCKFIAHIFAILLNHICQMFISWYCMQNDGEEEGYEPSDVVSLRWTNTSAKCAQAAMPRNECCFVMVAMTLTTRTASSRHSVRSLLATGGVPSASQR